MTIGQLKSVLISDVHIILKSKDIVCNIDDVPSQYDSLKVNIVSYCNGYLRVLTEEVFSSIT